MINCNASEIMSLNNPANWKEDKFINLSRVPDRENKKPGVKTPGCQPKLTAYEKVFSCIYKYLQPVKFIFL